MVSVPYIDDPVLRFLGQFARRSEAFDTFMLEFIHLDMFKGAIVLAVVWWLWFESRPDQRQQRTIVIQTILGGVFAGVASRFLQNWIERPKPINAAPEFVPLLGTTQELVAAMADASAFPSDHAALFGAVAIGIFLADRRWGYVAFAWTLLIVDLPRIYTGRHYPSDILAGVVLGICVTLAMRRPAVLLTGPVLRLEKEHTAWFYGLAFYGLYEMSRLFDEVRLLGNTVVRSTRIALE
jgi:membrane-associated phospholipid phosphatase